ncbi:DEAD/DEAH box helicase [Kocuria koreensis]|jgi:ATP-dependent RNA helicase HelY|uniref:DEAD/DEAH box helicase n=1 Tax=Rothia koreensis TaxID=592378 RepID=A0A7K1LGY1_9MICC|nr:DEAD/DEAH box helicase [Rothia koreensis]MUN54333.1 DEAD/DEAH box helicase [Rothia koreensis]
MPSYAEKYEAAKARSEYLKSSVGLFESSLDFPLDDFQREACEVLQDGDGVLVAAPTGAGKTVVGEFAVFLARRQGKKAFYTTPIKALSNQKFHDLSRIHGAENVGLLTGDISVNSEAPIMVMTTEVLRNMLYAQSSTLSSLGFVVMDEVHYLADRFRGAVWEEVMIHLPESVAVVSLSATISNAEEFGQWLDTVRGSTRVVVSEHRPVPLWQHVMAGHRLYDLFADNTTISKAADIVRRDGAEKIKVNTDLLKATSRRGPGPRRGPRRGKGKGQGRSGPPPMRRAPRPVVLRSLDENGLLPAIYFIFSRAACDDAVLQCIASDIRLTDQRQAQMIRAYIAEATASVDLKDLRVLGFDDWREGLSRGIAAHHAGMLPLFKEIVEHLFTLGLVKAVFATETLSLGINMPARSVVIEKLSKFNGEQHVDITPGEYTQLTGRAGRRGIDVEGHAVVLWNDGMDAKAIAGLASRRTYPLYSSFKPTYNMSVNLLDQFGVDRAMSILESSFAQFQADKSVVSLASKVRRQEKALSGYEESMTCHLGDYVEYANLKYKLNQTEKRRSKERKRMTRSAAESTMQLLVPGDVVDIPRGRNSGPAVVVGKPQGGFETRIGVVTMSAHLRVIGPSEFDGSIQPISKVKVPKHFTGRTPQDRRDMSARVKSALDEGKPGRTIKPPKSPDFESPEEDQREIDRLRRAVESHPCHGCSEREDHARWFNRWVKLKKETDSLRHQIDSRTNTIAQRFSNILDLLADYDYVGPDDSGEPQLRSAGETLRKIYGERDLLTSLALRDGYFEGLDPAALCAAASSLVYSGKRDETVFLRNYPAGLQERANRLHGLWTDLAGRERHHRLPETPVPDVGLMWSVYRWARGDSLSKSLEGSGLVAGDFVRATKQVIDALDQLGHAVDDPMWRTGCEAATNLIKRGVIVHELETPAGSDDDVIGQEWEESEEI